ncbi:MAG: hypothetical protein Edafosvirus17_10 [Edafosvirus sp.]|uniref:Uncharacterized protein n=1 Tax=Edafosvirus sp. TaxID=2487765 RepID=A0A3G4ZW02_9VIRU|nr:MAG: hypothetical protein Edafosvirus17_10 [Edafosvirus sp.]
MESFWIVIIVAVIIIYIIVSSYNRYEHLKPNLKLSCPDLTYCGWLCYGDPTIHRDCIDEDVRSCSEHAILACGGAGKVEDSCDRWDADDWVKDCAKYA